MLRKVSKITQLLNLIMIDFTVAICTYNGEKRLPVVLERLRAQINT